MNGDKRVAIYAPYIYPWMVHISELISGFEGVSECRFFSTGIYGNYPWEEYMLRTNVYRRFSVLSENIGHPALFIDFRRYSADYAILFACESVNTQFLMRVSKRASHLLVVEENSERAHRGLKGLLGYFKKIAVNSGYRRCGILVAESKRSSEYLSRLGISEDKIVVIPHGADIDKYRPREKDRGMLSRMGINEDKIVINYMGEFSEYKGGEYIAECALSKSFEERDMNVVFIFPNFGNLYDRYSARLGKCKHVRIRGKMTENEVVSLYSISDITVVPSKLMVGDSSDRSPNALIEGMCCGNAVIGTDVGGIPDIMGDAGVLVEPNNVKALEEAIVRLVSDRRLLAKYKRVSRERAEEKLDNRKYARRLFSLLEEGK